VNERIDQLWGQALDQAVPETYTRLSYSQVLKVKQVFAELIVRECLELTLGKDRKQLLDKGDLNGANLVQKDIIRVIKHFGVEQ